MKKYKPKPTEIEAITFEELSESIAKANRDRLIFYPFGCNVVHNEQDDSFVIITAEGALELKRGRVVVKHPKHGFGICPEDVFNETFIVSAVNEPCKLVCDDQRLVLTLPSGEPVPYVVKDTISVIVDQDLYKSGYVKVGLELFVRSNDTPYFPMKVQNRER